MYEGSLFYGSRFNDSKRVDELLRTGQIRPDDIVEADDYMKKKLSYILTGAYSRYDGLKKIRNRTISERLGLINTPYFNSVNANLISQYRT